MDQIHKRFCDEQVAFLLQAHSQGLMTTVEVEEVVGIGKSGLFAGWRESRRNPAAFTLVHARSNPRRIVTHVGRSNGWRL